MTAVIVQVQYHQLEAIALQFSSQAEQIMLLQVLLKQRRQILQQDGWEGHGAYAFFDEMDQAVFPTLTRLVNSLQGARSAILQIAQIFRQAEEDAASLFKSLPQAVAASDPSDNTLQQINSDIIDRIVEILQQFLAALKREVHGVVIVPKPPITTREEWGALPPNFDNSEGLYNPITNPDGYANYRHLKPHVPLPEILHTIVIHHEGNWQTYDPRAIQDRHMIWRGWSDIGYHYIIGPDGTIYEGRDINVRGTHVGDQNTGMVGILFLGDFEPQEIDIDDPGPTPQQLESAEQLVAYLDSQYEIDQVVGHQDVPGQATECPGDNLEPYVPGLDDIVK